MISLTHLLILLAIVVAIAAALLAARSSGPRVTTIERKTDRAESHEGEEP